MKTATTSLLPALLILVCCFAIGCQQQATKTVKSSSSTDGSVVDEDLELELGQFPEAGRESTKDDNTANQDDPSSEQTLPSSEPDESNEDEPNGEVDDSYAGYEATPAIDSEPAQPTIDIPDTWKRLSKKHEIWLDTKNKQVIVGGRICLDTGPLEMLICPKGTKEHESIVSVNVESWQVHAALIAAGASPGVPCRWHPEYTPAWGPKIEIEMMWRDEKTKKVKKIDGKQWIINIDTEKPMVIDLVFGGSYSEPEFEGEQARYQADDGELICLANFSTSAIDLRVSEENIDVFFEANTPLIPPLNTQIYCVIKPGPVLGKPEE